MKEWREWLKEINAGENYPMSTFAQAMLLLDNRLEALEEKAASAEAQPVTEEAQPTETPLTTTGSPSGAQATESTGQLMSASWQSVQQIMGAGPAAHLFVFVEQLAALIPSDRTHVLGAALRILTSLRLGSGLSVPAEDAAKSPSLGECQHEFIIPDGWTGLSRSRLNAPGNWIENSMAKCRDCGVSLRLTWK